MMQTPLSIALAAITFLLSVIWGMPLIRILRRWGVTEEQPSAPGQEALTMGGLLFVLPVVLLAALLNFADASGFTGLGLSILLPVGTMLAFTVLGAWMDRRRKQAKSVRGKPDWFAFLAQLALAGGAAYALRYRLDVPEMYLPFYKGEFELGLWYLPLAALLIAGTPNAFQVTTGVDGLAGLLGATAFAAYGAIAEVQGQYFLARFCFTVVGALLGYLWFNIKPAALHMGRTGTFALGSTLAVVALMSGQWPLLAAIAIVPLLELLSLGIQALVLKINPRRMVFRDVPLHAHYEVQGWSNAQIVQRFWLVNMFFAMIGITLAQV